MSIPANFWDAIDPAKFGARLAIGVSNCLATLDAFDRELRKGPGPHAIALHQAALKMKDPFESQVARMRASEYGTTADQAAKNLQHRVGVEILSFLGCVFQPPLNQSDKSKIHLRDFISDRYPGAKTLPMGTQSPQVRAALQIHAFRAVMPWVKKILAVCTNPELYRIWNVDELPTVLIKGEQTFLDSTISRTPFSWSLVAYPLERVHALCEQLLEHLLPNRWVRRRLAEDAEYLENAARILLLNPYRLEVVEGSHSRTDPCIPSNSPANL